MTNLSATVLVAVIGGLVVLGTVVVGTPLAGAEVSIGSTLAAVLHLVVLASALGLVAFGAATTAGSPGVGLGAGWGLLVASFVANGVAEMLDGAEWLASVSPWGWYGAGEALSDGIDPLGVGLLALLAVVAGTIGIATFERRDLGL